MTRNLPHFVPFCVVFVFLLAACGDEGPTVSGGTPGPDPVVHKEWAFLLYDDADFENAFNPLEDFRSQFRAGDEMHVLVLNDPVTSVASILRIDEAGVLTRVREMGEANMGAAGTVVGILRGPDQRE